ncbi:MAG: symmetrical bis(5'-nucleosyl)-tetraphosphatase [Thermoanaerobaculia bacterium]
MAATATYAIGDVHGCWQSLQALLDRLPWRPERDRLWLVGDLVNRGPGSLEVLRWARRMDEELGERFTCVLGNHEVHLLARAAGVAAARPHDTLDPVLAAPEGDELLAWVARRPLLHRDGPRLLVHAGLLPSWTAEEAEDLAREAERRLRRPGSRELLARYAARTGCPGAAAPDCRVPCPEPSDPDAGCGPADRALAVLTLLRVVDAEGRPRYGFTGPPEEAPGGTLPWFEAPGARWRHGPGEHRTRRTPAPELVCGHWAALGLRTAPGLRCLDSGCVWGGKLTALRLEDGAVFQVDCRDGDGGATGWPDAKTPNERRDGREAEPPAGPVHEPVGRGA